MHPSVCCCDPQIRVEGMEASTDRQPLVCGGGGDSSSGSGADHKAQPPPPPPLAPVAGSSSEDPLTNATDALTAAKEIAAKADAELIATTLAQAELQPCDCHLDGGGSINGHGHSHGGKPDGPIRPWHRPEHGGSMTVWWRWFRWMRNDLPHCRTVCRWLAHDAIQVFVIVLVAIRMVTTVIEILMDENVLVFGGSSSNGSGNVGGGGGDSHTKDMIQHTLMMIDVSKQLNSTQLSSSQLSSVSFSCAFETSVPGLLLIF